MLFHRKSFLNKKSNKAITLISLIVTIIVLLILSGTTIYIFNENILIKTKNVTDISDEAILKEKVELTLTFCKLLLNNNKITNTEEKEQYLKNFKDELEKDKTVIVSNIDIKESNILEASIIYNNKEYKLKINSNGKVLFDYRKNIKIGDYIEYPVEYDDVYSGEHFGSSNGWKVIDDGKINNTSGKIKLVSTGIPVKWYYDIEEYNNNSAIIKLNEEFESMRFMGKTSRIKIKGLDFKTEYSEKISVLSLEEIKKVSNLLIKENSKIKIDEKDNLFYISNKDSYYWLSTKSEDNETDMYYVNYDTISLINDISMGIRPVITLDDNFVYSYSSNVWKIDK